MNREQFNKLYWAAQPPEIRALEAMPYATEEDWIARFSAAMALVAKGFRVDTEIHAYNREPWEAMVSRKLHGYTWVPSLGQQRNFGSAPGAPMPQLVPGWDNRPYDPNNPPPGSIKVSLDPKDYPPFDPPEDKPAPVIPQGVPGGLTGPGYRGLVVGDTSPAGTTWKDPASGERWVKRIAPSMFGGASIWWQLEGK